MYTTSTGAFISATDFATATDVSRDRYIANPAIAAWTIVQDIGAGFFGVGSADPDREHDAGRGQGHHGRFPGPGLL